jgi:lysophospholipase L1-like esterase
MTPGIPLVQQVATVALGPVLLAQGWHVRRVTPRLPEAAGPREGIGGSGPRLRLLIAGDSAAAGVGVSSQSEALAGRLMSDLADRFCVNWKLVAHTGLSTQEVIALLESEPAQAFDVAVTSTGVNDITGGTPRRRWLALQSRLVDLLRQRFGVRHVMVSGLPPMHAFPALPQPLRWFLGTRARDFNRALQDWVARQAHCEFVAPDYPVQPEYMAADGFHPGAPAYALWAQHVADLIREHAVTA